MRTAPGFSECGPLFSHHFVLLILVTSVETRMAVDVWICFGDLRSIPLTHALACMLSQWASSVIHFKECFFLFFLLKIVLTFWVLLYLHINFGFLSPLVPEKYLQYFIKFCFESVHLVWVIWTFLTLFVQPKNSVFLFTFLWSNLFHHWCFVVVI